MRQTMDSSANGYPRLRRVVAAAVAFLILPYCTAGDSEDSQADQLQLLLEELNAPQFEARVAAERRLVTLQPAQILRLRELTEEIESPEAAVRVLHGLERHYVSKDNDSAVAASKVLEQLISSDRAVIAEEVTWILVHHWQQRQHFAVRALTDHGAQVVLPEALARARMRNLQVGFGNLDGPRIQVFIGAEWDATEEGRRAFDQLPGLAQQLRSGQGARQMGRRGQTPPLVTIFLVAGHSLSEEQAGQLKGAFGEIVQDRGETMLGITAQPGVAGGGCLVREVVEHGSAATAGLKSGDLITHVQSIKIGSFDDLVEELRQFSASDVVTIQCVREYRRRGRAGQVEKLKVTLRSWSDYARAINAAVSAPNYDAPGSE